jgi:hypothetical protein
MTYFLTLVSDHDEQESKLSLLTKFYNKNKLVESTDHEAGLSDARLTEVSRQNTDEGSGSKVEKCKLLLLLLLLLQFFYSA